MKRIRVVILDLIIICVAIFTVGEIFASGQALETIDYIITPAGEAHYQDMGLVDFGAGKANLVIFKSKALGFADTEKIYSDPKTYLPLKVERDVSLWFRKEYIVEDYYPKENKLIITKFESGKKNKEYVFQGKGPIHNAILLPFSLRKVSQLKIGWSIDIRLPVEFKVRLVSIENVNVPAGRFQAYHFISEPAKFEIWLSADEFRLPVKIKGLGGLVYTLRMEKHTLQEKKP